LLAGGVALVLAFAGRVVLGEIQERQRVLILIVQARNAKRRAHRRLREAIDRAVLHEDRAVIPIGDRAPRRRAA
jgi:hypothetical protein